MDSMAIFILSLLSAFTTNILNVSGISVRQKVSIIESKVKSLELLTSAHQTSFTEMAEDIADVNTTMLAMCAVNGRGVHVTKQESQHVRTEPVYDPREFNARLVQAFQDEKEFVRKQEKNISDKTNAFLKSVMEKVTQHEQRITDISNEFLNEFNEKVAETSMLTDGMEKRLNKVNTDIVDLFSTTSALKASVNTEVATLTNQVQKQLKTAEDEKEYVRKQDKNISDKTDEFIKTVMEKVTQHEQRITDISNEFLNEFNEKVAETSLLTDGMEKRLNKADTDIVQLYNSTAALKVAVNTHTSTLTHHIETRLKSAEDEITNLRQTSDAFTTALNSLNQSLLEKSDMLKTEVRSQNENLIAMFDTVLKLIDPPCPGGWQRFGLFCYKYFDSEETFADTRKICASHSAHVVDVASQPEMDFIMGLVTSAGKWTWLGLTDIDTEGTWKWDRTGAVATYLNWRPGQPDSQSGNQDCVFAGYDSPYDLWNDIGCSGTCRFVCKSSLV